MSAVIRQAIEGSCDHRGDPYPGYLGITDPAVIAAWRERYEIRMVARFEQYDRWRRPRRFITGHNLQGVA